MKTIVLEGFVHCLPAEKYDDPGHVRNGLKYSFWEYEKMGGAFALVAPHTITLEIADNFNPNSQFIEALEAKKKSAMAEFQCRITEIDRQISQFQAITMEAA